MYPSKKASQDMYLFSLKFSQFLMKTLPSHQSDTFLSLTVFNLMEKALEGFITGHPFYIKVPNI